MAHLPLFVPFTITTSNLPTLIRMSGENARAIQELYDVDSARYLPDIMANLRIKDELDNFNTIFCQMQAALTDIKINSAKKSEVSMIPVPLMDMQDLGWILEFCRLYNLGLDDKRSEVAGRPTPTVLSDGRLILTPSSAEGIIARIKRRFAGHGLTTRAAVSNPPVTWSPGATRIVWPWMEEETPLVIEDLECQRSCLNAMLALLTCDTALEAEENRKEIYRLQVMLDDWGRQRSERNAGSQNDVEVQLHERASIYGIGPSSDPSPSWSPPLISGDLPPWSPGTDGKSDLPPWSLARTKR